MFGRFFASRGYALVAYDIYFILLNPEYTNSISIGCVLLLAERI